MDASSAISSQELSKSICLLSLDGANPGTTEISELFLLKEIMQQIAYMENLPNDNPARPYKYFDLIGGTGVGGIFALFLAAWQLSVDETITAYMVLYEVFTSQAWLKEDVEVSEQYFNNTMRELSKIFGKEDHMSDDLIKFSANSCKAFTCTTNPANMMHPRLFRTYRARANQAPECSLADAFTVSVAGHSIAPLTLGQNRLEKFISATARSNNPSLEVVKEAQSVFGPSRNVACFVSIGAGQTGPLALTVNAAGESAHDMLQRITRDPEAVRNELEGRYGDANDLFIRLNVEHGLEDAGSTSHSIKTRNPTQPLALEWIRKTVDALTEAIKLRLPAWAWELVFSPNVAVTRLETSKLSETSMHAEQYLASRTVQKKLNSLVQAIIERPQVVTLERMNGVAGPDAQNIGTCIKRHHALEYLPYANGSSFNSTSGCLEGTRSDILSKIMDWIDSAKGPSSVAQMLLLSDVAGAGKTALAHTVAMFADNKGLLASSFFFRQGIESRDSPRYMLSTVIRDLAGRNQQFGDAVGSVIDIDRSLASADVHRQFEGLLLPCTKYLPQHQPIVIVIDALDEIEDAIALSELLGLLGTGITKLPATFRIFVTSRPLNTIVSKLNSVPGHILTEHIYIKSRKNCADLRAFAKKRLDDIAAQKHLDSWPASDILDKVVSKSEGLFIWASIVINLLQYDSIDPVETLRDILDNSQLGLSPEEKMDEMYSRILRVCGKWGDKNFRLGYTAVIGTIITAHKPLTLSAMQALYHHDSSLNRLFQPVLQALNPVLIGVDMDNADIPITLIHLSFRDFVTGPSHRKFLRNEWRISLYQQHEDLLVCCLQVLNDNFDKSTFYIELVNGPELRPVNTFEVSEAFQYALLFWRSHLDHLIDSITKMEYPISNRINQKLLESVPNLPRWVEFQTFDKRFQKFTKSFEAVKRYLLVSQRSLEGVMDSQEADYFLSLGGRLRDMNRLDEAVGAIEEAVNINRLIGADSGLAHSLNNLSVCLEKTESKKGLYYIEESVGIYRSLARARPDKFNKDLASALHNLFIFLARLRRWEKATKVIDENVGLCRQLAAARPKRYSFELANSLNDFSTALAEVSRGSANLERALKASEETVDILRQLRASHPEIHSHFFASSLHSLSNRLADLSRWEEATAAIQETVAIHRQITSSRPDALNPDFAGSLNNLATCLSRSGRQAEALEAAQEAVEMYVRLTAASPEEFSREFGFSQNTLSRLTKHSSSPTNWIRLRPRDIFYWLDIQSKSSRSRDLQRSLNDALNEAVV